MQTRRLTETNVFGYRIDLIETGHSSHPRYEVCAPQDGAVLASFDDRIAAEQFIVMRELRAIEQRPRSPAY
jgi:hypothetical protein